MKHTTTIPFLRFLTTKVLLPWFPFSYVLKLLQEPPLLYQDIFSGAIHSCQQCIEIAEAGEQDAMLLCGVLYWKGIDVEEDAQKAQRLLSKPAVMFSNVNALYLLAQIVLATVDDAKRREEALGWMKTCAKKKIENAMRLLAFYTAYGIYCDRSLASAKEQMAEVVDCYEDINKRALAYVNAHFNKEAAVEKVAVARNLAGKAKVFGEALNKLKNALDGEAGANNQCLAALSAGLWEARFPLATYYRAHRELSTPSEIASLYEKDAHLGLNPLADFRLGCMFAEGEGVAQSSMIAYARILKAAKRGIQDAQVYLNKMVQPAQGSGRLSSYSLSLQYYEKLKKEGEVAATYFLGLVNLFGLEGFDNADRAVHCFYVSAKKGSGEALVYLSHIINVGYTISKDTTLAAEYMEQANAIGYSRENLFPDCILTQPTNNREAAIRSMAQKGDVGAQFVLAILIHLRLVSGTANEMADWIRRSASGNPSAQYRLACMLVNTKKNDDEVRADQNIQSLIMKASSAGHLGAIFMRSIYAFREGAQQDEKLGVSLLVEAAEKGFSKAQHMLGSLYLGNRFFDRDEKKAVSYIQAAADGDCPEAMYDLAYFVEKDNKDEALALKLTERSAELGYRKAQLAVGQYYLENPESVANKKHGALWAGAWAAVGPNETKFLLAKAYYTGNGFPKDSAKAHQWFQEIKEGPYSAMALAYIGDLTLSDTGTDAVFRKALGVLFSELKESDSLDNVKSAAEQNRNPYVLIQGVLTYLETKKPAESIPWLEKSKESKVARYILGELYTQSEVKGREIEKTFYALGEVVGKQFSTAQKILARIYERDADRVEKFETFCADKAILNYMKCDINLVSAKAVKGISAAECALGMRYCTGLGVPVNLAKAYFWFARAGRKGIAVAVCFASIMSHYGIGTLIDEEQSLAILERYTRTNMKYS
ncbi:MAG: sel1 repeat family protein [Desulfovibrionaceae bacterium]|nr:sel1 repeat family protein [Desulfovibrionaceae bacterium]